MGGFKKPYDHGLTGLGFKMLSKLLNYFKVDRDALAKKRLDIKELIRLEASKGNAVEVKRLTKLLKRIPLKAK